ncbi:MAG TPA: hypothetical protein VHK69_02890 [Chitinophagaceae bacterium]|jgi:hypothetical protein|nr:hypothetical protein [Chitinophagaceae bacterium]
MARQTGPEFVIGTIRNLNFYMRDGKYYVRSKSSLTARRIRKDPAFAASRQCSQVFGRASRIASAVRRQVPPQHAVTGLYQSLVRRALELLRQGQEEAQVQEALLHLLPVRKG